MKFIVSSSALLKQLQQISGVINANTVLPILEDFLFEIEKNKLTVVATDLETVMKVHLDIEAKDSGKVCIPAKILMDSLKNIPEQIIIGIFFCRQMRCDEREILLGAHALDQHRTDHAAPADQPRLWNVFHPLDCCTAKHAL